MLLLILSYLGGVLTILSPCILPVLPFVFARTDQPFVRSGLPLLIGMVLAFAVVATLAAVGGGWVIQANQYGRWLAMALFTLFGLTLLFPNLSTRLTNPIVNAGSRLSQTADKKSSIGSSLLLGVATGMLWAPCAGPILGLLLTGAALNGANIGTSFLLLAYALGAATSLALALLIGGKVFSAMKRSLGVGEWIRKGLGVLMLFGVLAIGLGWDTTILAQVSGSGTGNKIEQQLVDRLATARQAPASNTPVTAASELLPTTLPVEGTLPSLNGAVQWLNSEPLTAEQLKGKVVLIDFWTYSCINCLRSLPYVKAWAAKYHDSGLVVIGVHSPEFAFEHNVDNVKKAIKDLGINYPVAVDNNFALWRNFNNQYWPAHYFVDAQGRIRYHHFGEGDYAHSEQVIQQLLKEAGKTLPTGGTAAPINAVGSQLAQDSSDMNSPETYVGYNRAQNFASPEDGVADKAQDYSTPAQLSLNQWSLQGNWTIGGENTTLNTANGSISFRFHARDLHLVLGPAQAGKNVRFRVTIDGKAPEANHGTDIAADGTGVITEQRLYQLVRQQGDVQDHTFTIEFLDAGAQAYAFTFG